MASAQILPMKATPKADIGMAEPAVEPAKPTQASGTLMKPTMIAVTKPTPISTALRPPLSPALIASAAAAARGGKAPVTGKRLGSSIR